MDDTAPAGWHLSKQTIVTIMGLLITAIIFLFGQTVSAVWWASKIDSRVSTLENQRSEAAISYNDKQAEQDRKITMLEKGMTKIDVIERVQADVIKRLDIQTGLLDKNRDKLDLIISNQGRRP